MILSILLSIFITTISLNADELQWVDEQINAIKPPRNGLSTDTLVSIYNPFIFLQKTNEINSSKETVAIYLKAKTVKKTKTYKKKKVKKHSKRKKIKQRVYYGSKYLTLNAIMNKSALINNRWYKIDDKISKFKIKSITRTSVVLIKKNVKMILSTKSKSNTLNFKK